MFEMNRSGFARKLTGLVAAGFFLVINVPNVMPASADITQAQAIARVRSILNNKSRGCSIDRINSVRASRVGGGWRVTASIVMSASGRRRTEQGVWIVSQRNGAVAQNQLTSEIAMGCP